MLSFGYGSSISWSSYHKGLLASSDYEGTVTLWDACTGTKTRSFQVSLFSIIRVILWDYSTVTRYFGQKIPMSLWVKICY